MHKVIQNKLEKSLSGRVTTRRGWHQMLHRRASGARQREDERRSPVATGRANAARGGALVTGPALRPALLIIPFLAVLSFLYINIYVETALRSSSAISDSQSHQVVVSDATNLTISFLDDSGTATTSPTNIVVTPSAAGVFNSGDVTIDVSTNYDYGYTLTMSASTSSLSRSEAVGDRTYEIPTLLASKDDNNNPYTCTPATSTSCNFPKNYWGLKRTSAAITDAGYIPMIPNYNMPVTTTDAGADSSTSTVTVGVKLSNETPYGLYTIDMNFLAVANLAPSTAYMQDATPSSLAYLMPNVGDSTVLYDKRDNQEYTIAKLADGKYWMTKNLNLAGGTVLTSDDTDMAPGYTMPTTYVDPDSGATLPTGFGEGNSLPASSKTGFDNDYNAFIYNTGNNTDTCTDPGCYSYYSYNAATLGSGMDISSDNTDAPYSVCPKGWKLPTSRSTLELAKTSSDFYQMAIHYGLKESVVNEDPDNEPEFCNLGGDCSTNTVPRFLRAGYYGGSTFDHVGAYGYYWSSTASSSTNARNLRFYSGYVSSTNNNSRRYGFSVRCLFDDTMQSFSSDYASALAMEESVQLRDNRDNKYYWVTKLKDNNVWMTQNLDLDLDSSVALTSADTDLHSVTSWTPVRSTIDSTAYNNTASGASGGILTFNNGAQNGNFAPGFSNSTSSDMTVNANNSPYSADPGYRYVVPKEMSGPNTNWYDNGDTFYYCANQDTTCGGNSENGHYTMGNFYNFAAASATNNVETTLGGSANVVEGASMPDSICPKGWRLPIDKTTNNEFNTLLGSTNYNVTSSFNPQGLNAIRTAPLYFVRSGLVDGGTLRDAGVGSHTWSSTISSSTTGYDLRFNSADINPASNANRLYGFSVRCLLRTE